MFLVQGERSRNQTKSSLPFTYVKLCVTVGISVSGGEGIPIVRTN